MGVTIEERMDRNDRDSGPVVVRIQIEASREELEDLVEVVVGRLAEAGLVVAERRAGEAGRAVLVLRPAPWVG